MASRKIEIYDPEEEHIRRVRLALFTKFTTEGYSKKRSIRVDGQEFAPGEVLDPISAKKLAFQLAGRRAGYPFLEPGTNIPTEESRYRAKEKLSTPDAAVKRQQYEEMLAVGRKRGRYRLVAERKANGRGYDYVLQPGDLRFDNPELAQIALEYFNARG
jgi:hypothetical protein